MAIFLALIFGTLPGIIWLFFYLQEDVHPEPKRLILQVFFLGILVAPIILFIERGIIQGELQAWSSTLPLFVTVLIMAGVEEVGKYAVVRLRMYGDPEFDEPIDAMIYMVVVALGFATVENILFGISAFTTSTTVGLGVASARFLGSTLLHTLSSSIIGYGIAVQLISKGKRWLLFLGTFVEAILLHTLFNYIILINGDIWGVLASTALVVVFAFFVHKAYKKIRHFSLIQ